MNGETKRILSKFLFACVTVTCLLCFCAGVVTAKQRSDYNSHFTSYAVLSVKNEGTAIEMNVNEDSYSFDLGSLKPLLKYKNYLYFTPFSSVMFFFDSVYEFFSSFKD